MKKLAFSTACALSTACIVTLASSAAPHAQEAAIYSGQDRVHPVWAREAMVAAQEAVAARIGLDILQKGGNAVDAGAAVALALAVTLPRAGNIGGGGFMLVHDAKSGETKAIDYRERATAAATRDMYLDEEGNADSELSRYHGLAVGVPGTVAGLQLALETYGTMTLAEVIQPAIELAEKGITVTADLADSLKGLEQRLKKWPSSQKVFYKEDGSFYEPGDTIVQGDLAATLKRIAEEGPKGFYEGETAQKIVDAVTGAGGNMTLEDLASYEPVIREPVHGTYRGYEIVSMPPPSSGGIHIIQILNVLEGYPLGFLGHNSAETIHLMAEAMKRAYADRSEYLGDPDFVDVPIAALTSKDYAKDIQEQISVNVATPSATLGPADLSPYESNETTHFSIVDKDGNAVANTYTINFSYGSGLVADGTGVLLNNELDDFAAKPGSPNAFGLVGGKANAPGPRKRPLSSMTPTIVLKDGKPEIVTGSPGGPRIITTVLEQISDLVDHGMNAAEAMEAPRFHHQWLPDELRVERGLSLDTIRLLREKGQNVVVGGTLGSVATIQILDGLMMGASDSRQRGTAAVGW